MARNNPRVTRMGDEYDRAGWESPWHRAPQQLRAFRKTLAGALPLDEPRKPSVPLSD